MGLDFSHGMNKSAVAFPSLRSVTMAALLIG
jgi:hypothetical protein